MNIKAFLLSLFSFTFLTFSIAYAQSTPETFIVSLIQDAKTLSNLPTKATQEQKLLEIVRRGFDVPLIAGFVVGQRWKNATGKQKVDFLDVFEKASVRSFSPLIKDVPLDKFKIIQVNNVDETNTIVVSSLETDSKIIKINWRLQYTSETQGYKVIDIVAEGISLIITLRSEYGAYMKNNDGLDSLISMLRQKAEE